MEKNKSLVNNEEVINLWHAKVNIFSDSVSCLGKVNQNPTSILIGTSCWIVSTIHHKTKLWTQSMENPWNSSGIFSQDAHCKLVQSAKVHKQIGRTRTIPRTNHLHVDVQQHHNGKKDNEQECFANATLVKNSSRTLVIVGPGSEKKWYSAYNERPQGESDRVAELMMIKFRETGFPVLRATSPLSRGKSKSKRSVNSAQFL